MNLRVALVITCALILGGCVASPDRDDSAAETPAWGGAQLEQLAERLPGRYGPARRLDQAGRGETMVLSARAGTNAGLVLELQPERATRPRGFMLNLSAADGPSPFVAGTFVPLRADGRPAPQSCAMRFRIRSGLLAGETDPAQCRFGSGGDSVGLLKELALDGNQIVIADQLVGAEQGAGDAPDILRLYRLQRFTGQVRVRSDETASWRLAEQIEAAVGGDAIEPVDAADMGLGVRIRLELIEGKRPGSPLLYLQVIDAQSDEILGQAWSDVQAERIGLALDRVQVDLEQR
ncbi:MAG: hypothetical protein ACOCVP_02910 [Wenzhouxiangella sp.]